MTVIITQFANESFESIVSKYSENKVKLFSEESISVIDRIVKNNWIGSSHKKTSYRKFLISDQVYLFYKIEGEFIYVTYFWDNKRNPLDLEIILSS